MQLELFQAGPLSGAARPFADPDAPRPDAAAMLARLLDLRGGVHLAEHLDEIWALRDAEPPRPAATDGLMAELREELDRITGRLDDAFDNARRPRYRLPTDARLLSLVQSAASRRRAARAAWTPHGEFLKVHSKRARFALVELRQSVCPRLLALGGEAAALVRLDDVLVQATAARHKALLADAFVGIERRVEAAFKGIDLTDVAQLRAAVDPIFDDARALYRALFQHRRRALLSLVAAALDSIESPDPAQRTPPAPRSSTRTPPPRDETSTR